MSQARIASHTQTSILLMHDFETFVFRGIFITKQVGTIRRSVINENDFE